MPAPRQLDGVCGSLTGLFSAVSRHPSTERLLHILQSPPQSLDFREFRAHTTPKAPPLMLRDVLDDVGTVSVNLLRPS